jgi:hypothetical protein
MTSGGATINEIPHCLDTFPTLRLGMARGLGYCLLRAGLPMAPREFPWDRQE